MKTSRPSNRPRVSREARERTRQNYEQALRACEAAAARIKSAGEDLAACWSALCLEIAAGVSPTDLLRKRAWCNVLELRLKEQAHALEAARLGIDAVWDDMMLTARARESFERYFKKNTGEPLSVRESLPMLSRMAATIAESPDLGVLAKK
jgi:hypothetical protein